MRAEAWPLIEQDIAAGEFPAEFVPEIRQAFESGVITKWKMHRAVRERLERGASAGDRRARSRRRAILTKKYVNAEGKTVGWADVSGDAEHGHVDLGAVLS